MKLKLWVQVVLIIISIISGIMIMYNVEISMMPFIISSIIFYLSTSILCEYGTLFDKLKVKLEEFMSR